jgi:hypothetical protein
LGRDDPAWAEAAIGADVKTGREALPRQVRSLARAAAIRIGFAHLYMKPPRDIGYIPHGNRYAIIPVCVLAGGLMLKRCRRDVAMNQGHKQQIETAREYGDRSNFPANCGACPFQHQQRAGILRDVMGRSVRTPVRISCHLKPKKRRQDCGAIAHNAKIIDFLRSPISAGHPSERSVCFHQRNAVGPRRDGATVRPSHGALRPGGATGRYFLVERRQLRDGTH